jgi:hypothetical protein
MAPLDRPIVLADAWPLIHLDELVCLDLLADFSAVHTTQQVWREVTRHRPTLTPQTVAGLHIDESARPVGSAVMTMAGMSAKRSAQVCRGRRLADSAP